LVQTRLGLSGVNMREVPTGVAVDLDKR